MPRGTHTCVGPRRMCPAVSATEETFHGPLLSGQGVENSPSPLGGTLPTHSQINKLKRYTGSSAGKEPTCNAGDPGLIPRSGRSPGEGIGHQLQCSWASMVVQTVKNLPAMRETWVRSLGWEDSLKEDMAADSSILAWTIAMDRGAWRAIVRGVTKSRTRLSN